VPGEYGPSGRPDRYAYSPWGQAQTFSEQSAQRIFHAADQILRAGYPEK
jgi:hypothetical protein